MVTPQRNHRLKLTASTVLLLASVATVPAHAKSFFEIIERPILTHPEVLGSRANVAAQYEGINEIQGQYLPSIDLNAGYGKENSDTTTIDDESLSRRETSVSLTQLIYDGHSVSSRYQQQTATWRSAKMSLADDQNNIMLEAINAYLDSVRTREIARLAEANEQEHIDTLDKVKQLFAGGAGRKGDISLAEGRLAQTRATLVRLENNIKDANANYKSIIGEDLTYKVRWPKVAEGQLPKSLDEAIKLALNNNPSLLTVREDAAAADWGISASKASFYPTINLELSAARNDNLDGTSGKNNEMQMMLRGSWNIFSGGSDSARYHQSVQRQIEARENVSQTQRTVVQQVTLAWNQYKTSLERLDQLRKHMVASREVLDAYEEQFKYGQRQLFNLLDQKNELFDSKVAYVNGRDEMIRRSFGLLKEAGRLTSYILDERAKEKNIAAKKREREVRKQHRQRQQQVLEKRMQRMQQQLDKEKRLQQQLQDSSDA